MTTERPWPRGDFCAAATRISTDSAIVGSTDPVVADQLSLSTKWLSAAVVRITAAGAIDASNAAELANYVFRHAANSRRLILDLKSVDFLEQRAFQR